MGDSRQRLQTEIHPYKWTLNIMKMLKNVHMESLCTCKDRLLVSYNWFATLLTLSIATRETKTQLDRYSRMNLLAYISSSLITYCHAHCVMKYYNLLLTWWSDIKLLCCSPYFHQQALIPTLSPAWKIRIKWNG